MHGDPNKMAAAGKHYSLMTEEEIHALPVVDIMKKSGSWLYLWGTCPRLDLALRALDAWGLYFRGLPWIWCKTKKDGTLMGARGIRPTHTKPTSEIVVAGSLKKRGRPLPVLDEAARQLILAPVGAHSAKPVEIYDRIEQLHGDRKRIDLFNRGGAPDGWDTWGDEAK